MFKMTPRPAAFITDHLVDVIDADGFRIHESLWIFVVPGRYVRIGDLDITREAFDDGWEIDEDIPKLVTSVTEENPKSIINRNQSPDLPFELSINPFRGCEHGCVYCYARPAHAYVDLSPGLDFESKLFAKPNAAEVFDLNTLNKTQTIFGSPPAM